MKKWVTASLISIFILSLTLAGYGKQSTTVMTTKDISAYNVPTNLKGVVAVATGGVASKGHNLALKSDGAVVALGGNYAIP